MSSKLIDLTFLETVAKGNKEFVLKIANSFINQATGDLEKLKQYVKDKNWEGIHFIAHKMKSSVHFVGIHSVKDLIINIERSAKDKVDLDKLPPLVEEFIATCKTAIKQLEEEIKNYTLTA